MKQHNLILKRHFDIFFSNALLIYIFSLLVSFSINKNIHTFACTVIFFNVWRFD